MSKGHFRTRGTTGLGADQSFEFWLNSERELMVGWVHDDGMSGDAATLSYTDIVALKALLDDPELWDGYSGGCPRPVDETLPGMIKIIWKLQALLDEATDQLRLLAALREDDARNGR